MWGQTDAPLTPPHRGWKRQDWRRGSTLATTAVLKQTQHDGGLPWGRAVTSPFSLFMAEHLSNLQISAGLLASLPGPGVTHSLCFFFSSPSPFTFSLSLSLFVFLGLGEDEGALWRKKSLCLKSLCVFDGGCDPPVAGTEGLPLPLLVFPGLTLHDPAPLLQLLAGGWSFSLTLPLPPTPPSLRSFLVLLPLSSTRTFLGGGGWKPREGCEPLSGVPLASLGLTSGLLREAAAGAPAEAAAGAPLR